MIKITLSFSTQAIIYLIGILSSIFASKLTGADWIPENKFSFAPSAIFPASVLTFGSLVVILEIFSFQPSPINYLIPILFGVVIGVIVTQYLDVINPPIQD